MIIENEDTLNFLIKGGNTFIIPHNGNVYKLEDKKSFIEIFSPVQEGDEIYIKEKFSLDEILLGGEEVLYKNEFSPRDFKNSVIGYGLTTDKMKERILERCTWKDASNMTYQQSRIKDKYVAKIQVIRTQDITKDICESLGIKKGLMDMYRNYENIEYGFGDYDYDLKGKDVNGQICSFRTWLSKHYNIKYEDNSVIFIITMKDKLTNEDSDIK